jgi:site-specific recombinase XerD
VAGRNAVISELRSMPGGTRDAAALELLARTGLRIDETLSRDLVKVPAGPCS